MATKKTCVGVVTNQKNPGLGNACRRWAVTGSEYCAVHGESDRGNYNPADLQNRCIAHSTRTKQPCKLPAIAGGTVCRIHGGSAKHVQKKARELLDRAVEPALHQLRDILLKPGTSDSDRLRAIQMVMDRSGLTPGMTVQHELKPWQVTLQHVFKENGEVTINRTIPEDMQAELDAVPEYAQPSVDDIEDAEVVEDDDFEPTPMNILSFDRPVRGSAEPPRRKR